MSNFSLGSGLESFSSFMDVEAEATVKINAGDDSSSEPLAAEDTAAPEVEEEIATTEKSDEDIDTAADNVNQTMNYALKLMDDYTQCMTLYHVAKKHGVSAGLVEYANLSFAFESRCRSLGLVVPAIEADAGPNNAGNDAKADNGPSAWDKTKDKARQFGNNAKTVGSNVLAKLKEIGRRILEFIKNLFRKIYDFFASQQRVVRGLLQDLSNAPKTLNMSNEVKQRLSQVLVVRPAMLKKKLGIVITELQGKEVVEDIEKDFGNVNPNATPSLSLNGGDIDRIAYYNAYPTKRDVEEVLKAAEDALGKMDQLKRIESVCSTKIAENVKKIETLNSVNTDATNAQQAKQVFENIKTYVGKFITGIPGLVKEAIQVGRVYIDNAKKQEQDSMLGNNPQNNQSPDEEEYRRANKSARRDEGSGKFVKNTPV